MKLDTIMNPSKERMTRPATDASSPSRPNVYWVMKRWGGRSAATAARYGVSIYENPFEHEGLSGVANKSPQDLMRRLKKIGWKTAAFTNSPEKIARVEVTRAGFNVVYFPSYAAAVEAHKCKPSEAGLPACPFCRLSDQLDITAWTNERMDGSEYTGDAVRCLRCDAIAPLTAWLSRRSVSA